MLEQSVSLIPIEWIMVIVFIAGAIVRGFLMHKSTGTLDNLFLAGRKVPGLIASLSTVATNMNANDFIGSAGTVYLVGAIMVHGNLLHGVALIFVALVVMQKIRRLNVFTLGGWLEKRYSPAVGNTYSIIWTFVWMLFNLGLYLYVGAFVLKTLVGWDLYVSIVCLSIIAAFYTLLGGFGAVIASDVLSVALMFFPFLFLTFAVWGAVGGPAELAAALPAAKGDFWASQTRFGPLGIAIFGVIFMHISYWTCEAQVVQRPLSSKSEEDASVSYIGASFWYTILVPLMISLPALAALKLFPGLESPDFAMPMLIKTYIPRGLYGMVVVGLMAGVFSSADSQINAFCAMFTSDIYKKLIIRDRNKEHYLLVSKIAGVIFTLAAIGTAVIFSIESVHSGMMLFALSVLATIMPPFGAITIMGALFRRVNKHGALIGLIAGITVAVALLVAFRIDYDRIVPDQQVAVTAEAADNTISITAEENDGLGIKFAKFMKKTKSIISDDLYFRAMVTFIVTALLCYVCSLFSKETFVTDESAKEFIATKLTPQIIRLIGLLLVAIVSMYIFWTYYFRK